MDSGRVRHDGLFIGAANTPVKENMAETPEVRELKLEKNRLEALTDGIFAFAMTLLVTSLILPRSAFVTDTSAQALVSLIPEFYHYIIAFFVLAAFWMAHHRQFSHLTHLNQVFVTMSIIGLFLVTMVPFSTSFIGDYADPLSSMVFEFNLLALGFIFTFQWFYATRNHRLVSKDVPPERVRIGLMRGLIIPVTSFAGILIALTGCNSSTMIYLMSPVVSFIVEHHFRENK